MRAGADDPRSAAVAALLDRAVTDGRVHGAAWLVARGDDVVTGTAGEAAPGRAVRRDTLFRLSSTTKPVVAAAALTLVDDGTLGLDAPVDRWLPELAGRRVLADPAGPLDATVPAERPITVRDVLESRIGLGFDFTSEGPDPVLAALAAGGLHVGPPAPQADPDPDTWLAVVGGVPLAEQPGTRWRYHLPMQVLGVLVARAAGAPLPQVLRARVLDPAGMTRTGFHVPADQRHRFGRQWATGPGGDVTVYDEPDGQWARPPAFPDGGAGLVATVDDVHAFARVLRAGGTADDGTRVLAAGTVEAMLSPHVGPLGDDGRGAWGLGIGLCRLDMPDGRRAGTYGWDGGLGSTWWTDPVQDVVAVLLTTDAWTSPEPSPLFQAFWSAAFGGA
ncbi:serine hydrolase domain-containing protein [Cellulomonas telluris]|uniref:serine hydrolase domain-containing protein n=1 Tax=Cellulomonas telluris TaxID=2306636 RepID=UPI0014562F2E|nr:serine hydrolase domain-containing protein [Cellulomonas telluris]